MRNVIRFWAMNWRKHLASTNAGFWLFISLAFFGSMIWAKSRDPFERIWFTVKTPHYGKVKGVAVLPVKAGAGERRSQNAATGLPVVFYVYGSGGSLINSGNELRQLAELGMAAVAIEYNQTNQAAFEEQFMAAREWAGKEIGGRRQETGIWGQDSAGKSDSALRVPSSAFAWVGFSLGAERTLRFLLKNPEMQPQLYVRLAGGSVSELDAELKTKNSKLKTHVLLVHGENDEIFPVEEAKEAAEFFKTNGFATELKILPGKNHGFDADRAVVFRSVGEQIKAQLTPEHPLPEFPVTKNYPFVLCILPAFLWIGFWIYLRRKERRARSDAPYQNIEHPTSNAEHRKLRKWEIALRITAIILATLALAQTGIHLITPRLAVSDMTIKIARKWFLAPKWKEDFETLAAKPFWRGQRLKTLLTHVELANYCVYELINWKVDKEIYNEFVLSPVIDVSSDETFDEAGQRAIIPELNWRRPLWEFFYPRIRKENSPQEAAEIVVRNLRERVTIVSLDTGSAKHWPTGVETIWRNQITDEKGFERIYVAALRSVGVGARLNSEGHSEFWTASEWKLAPRPLINLWSQE